LIFVNLHKIEQYFYKIDIIYKKLISNNLRMANAMNTMKIEIITNLSVENTPNNKTENGRKICPITMQILTTNNSIKIEGVLYSMVGIRMWLKMQIKNRIRHLESVRCPCCNSDFNKKTNINFNNISIENFVNNFIIKSPCTNLPYNKETTKRLFEIYIENYRNLKGYNRGDLITFINS